MKTRLLVLIVLIVGQLAGERDASAGRPATGASRLSPGLRLLQADSDGLVLEWTAPPVQVGLVGGAVEVTADGCDRVAQPASPRLPFASALVALPPGTLPRLQITGIQEELWPLPAPLALAPYPEGVILDRFSRPIGGAFVPVEKQVPAREHLSSVPAVLNEIGIMRGVRLARLTLYPARPSQSGLQIVRRLRLEITWIGRRDPALPMHDLLSNQLRQVVINPLDVVEPISRGMPEQLGREVQPVGPAGLIKVETPGLYRIEYEELLRLDLADVDPRTWRLFQGGQEVAMDWEGDADAFFEPGEGLFFYAQPRSSRWTNNDVYALRQDLGTGTRMSVRSAAPAGYPQDTVWIEKIAEVNNFYTPDCFCGHLPAGHDGDRWIWGDLKRPGYVTASYPVDLVAAAASQPAVLTAWLIGYTDLAAVDLDHRVDVALNGVWVGRVEWGGRQAITATWPISPNVLHAGHNTVTLSLPGLPGVNVEGAWLDAVAFRYGYDRSPLVGSAIFGTGGNSQPKLAAASSWSAHLPLVHNAITQKGAAYSVAVTGSGSYRAFDVTDPLHPSRLTDVQVQGNIVTLAELVEDGPRRYLVVAEDGIRPAQVRVGQDPWRLQVGGTATGADILIVTHPILAEALAPLVRLRQAQGLTTALVNVLGIYDVWGDGRPDPGAIRAFIADAYTSWTPRPTFVLLAGDGSFDPKGFLPGSPGTLVPPYLADVDPWAGETAADNGYVAVDGDDRLPDMLVGRLPTGTVTETQALVGKIVQYETLPLPGKWNENVVFVADNPDGAGDFAAESELVATTHVTAPFTARRIYFVPPVTPVTVTQQAVLNHWNAGAFAIHFAGHSSWQQWAMERFLHLDDVPVLLNDRRWPVVVEMTCFTAAFHRPEPTLDEMLVKSPRGGAIAAWGGTGLGVSTGHAYLDDGFWGTTLTTLETLGQAVLRGKLSLAATGQYLDLLDTFTLLGDPALRLGRAIVPWADQVYLPVVVRSF